MNGGQGKIIGYQVNNEISVVVRDLTKVGTIVDTAVTAGATSVDGIDFRVANQGPAETQARANADRRRQVQGHRASRTRLA